MPLSSRWVPVATVVVFGLVVGGASGSIVAAVAAVLAVAGLLVGGRGRILPLAASGALLGAVGAPRDADAFTLHPVPGGYALVKPSGEEVFRGAKRACLREARASGALRVVVRT